MRTAVSSTSFVILARKARRTICDDTMMITRRDWWFGILLIAFVLLLHAAVPRYNWEHLDGMTWTRADRWTGHLTIAAFTDGQWIERDARTLGKK